MRLTALATLCLVCAFATLPTAPAAAADGWTLNTFRNPSVGLEYRRGAVSVHSGYYTTILRNPGDADSEPSGFWRTGATLWWGERAYASLSHLRGLDGQRRSRDFAIVEAGVQFEPRDGLKLRLGLALIPASQGFERKLNPTPGVSLALPL